MSLLAFLKDDSLVPDLYNHLFGDFHIYGFTVADFEELYKTQETDITTLQPVLDLPSVILLFELEHLATDYTRHGYPEKKGKCNEYTDDA